MSDTKPENGPGDGEAPADENQEPAADEAQAEPADGDAAAPADEGDGAEDA